MEQKIVGVIHVDVDAATYAEGARVGAEAHARSKGIAFRTACLRSLIWTNLITVLRCVCQWRMVSLTGDIPSGLWADPPLRGQ